MNTNLKKSVLQWVKLSEGVQGKHSMNIFTILKNKIWEWKGSRDVNRYERIMGDIEQEADPQVKLEKQVLLELRGTLLGGMASSTAYMAFKRNYFVKLASDNERERVKDVLLKILKSNEYKSPDKEIAAYACADIVILDAIPEIEKLVRFAKKGSIAEIEFNRSLEALRLGIPIYEYILKNVTP